MNLINHCNGYGLRFEPFTSKLPSLIPVPYLKSNQSQFILGFYNLHINTSEEKLIVTKQLHRDQVTKLYYFIVLYYMLPNQHSSKRHHQRIELFNCTKYEYKS